MGGLDALGGGGEDWVAVGVATFDLEGYGLGGGVVGGLGEGGDGFGAVAVGGQEVNSEAGAWSPGVGLFLYLGNLLGG